MFHTICFQCSNSSINRNLFINYRFGRVKQITIQWVDRLHQFDDDEKRIGNGKSALGNDREIVAETGKLITGILVIHEGGPQKTCTQNQQTNNAHYMVLTMEEDALLFVVHHVMLVM